jgi:hypothetical protein
MEFEGDEDADGKCKGNRGQSSMRWILIGSGLGVAIVGAIVFFILKYNRAPHSTLSTVKRPKTVVMDTLFASELAAVTTHIRAKQKSMWDEWDVSNFPLFLSTMDIPPLSWEIQKHKFIIKMLKTGSDFVVGFSGSSITAGHDSFFNESFPLVFYDDMKNIMKELNITFEVRNHALGNNPCYPYDACINTHVGKDLDMITWEQSMNCGHDPKPLESFTRSAIRAVKKPVILYMQSGTPYWKPDECGGKVFDREPLTDLERSFLNRSVKSIAMASPLIEEMEFLQPTKRKERSNTKKHINVAYSTAPLMGQSVVSLEAYKCLGPYGIDFGEKSGGGGSSWHPGMKGHRVRGNSMSYFILEVLVEAIESVIKDMADMTVKEIKAKANAFLAENQMQRPPEKPVACDAKFCTSDPACFTEYEPRVGHSLRDIVVGNLSSNWTLDVSFFDAKAILKAQLRGRGYLDKKYIYLSHSPLHPISLLVKPSLPSHIWICELQKGFLQYPHWLGDLDVAAEVFADLGISTGNDATALENYEPPSKGTVRP